MIAWKKITVLINPNKPHEVRMHQKLPILKALTGKTNKDILFLGLRLLEYQQTQIAEKQQEFDSPEEHYLDSLDPDTDEQPIQMQEVQRHDKLVDLSEVQPDNKKRRRDIE